ncbi:MAG: hypothetical protein HYS53_00425 [Candidatus Aenigmarchaeota archaeon]|nr:hypothetical protein [Candidatus Aenigmarchaeota archaeon]
MIAETWYSFLVFCTFLITVITLYARSARFMWFAFFGSLAGFLFDYSAVSLGYYSYNQAIDTVIVGKIPLTINFAEGVGMSSIIFVFETLWKKPRN